MRYKNLFAGATASLAAFSFLQNGCTFADQTEIVAKIKGCRQVLGSIMNPIKEWWKESKQEYTTNLNLNGNIDIRNGQGIDETIRYEKKEDHRRKLNSKLTKLTADFEEIVGKSMVVKDTRVFGANDIRKVELEAKYLYEIFNARLNEIFGQLRGCTELRELSFENFASALRENKSKSNSKIVRELLELGKQIEEWAGLALEVSKAQLNLNSLVSPTNLELKFDKQHIQLFRTKLENLSDSLESYRKKNMPSSVTFHNYGAVLNFGLMNSLRAANNAC